jgi:signal peptidase
MFGLEEMVGGVKRLNKRQAYGQILNALSVVLTAFMIWKALSVALNNESPIVVVLSESMSPAFERGDILFLSMTDEPLRTGDICVFNIKGRDIPIVHRIVKATHPKVQVAAA